ARHDDLDRDELVARAAALEPRHAVARQPEGASARGGGRDLHRDLAAQGRNLDRGTERRLGRRDRQGQVDVVPLALEERMRGDGDAQVQVAARAGRAGTLTGDADALAALHAGGDLHVDLALRALPPAAAARGARLSLNVAGAPAHRARLLEVHRERLARAVEGLVERDLDARLDVRAARGPIEAFVEPDASGAGAAPGVGAKVSEDRAEELGEVAEVAGVSAVLHSEAASGRACWWGLGVSLPVRSERIVAAALLGVGENLVGLADLLEAVGRVLGLRDVRVVLPREPAIGGLDRLVVRFPVDP